MSKMEAQSPRWKFWRQKALKCLVRFGAFGKLSQSHRGREETGKCKDEERKTEAQSHRGAEAQRKPN